MYTCILFVYLKFHVEYFNSLVKSDILTEKKEVFPMKKFIVGLIVGLILATSSSVFAANPIKLIVNGNEIHPDVPPQIVDGRTLVPARALAEALGANVEWDGANNAVVVKSSTTPTLKNDIIKENIEGGANMDGWLRTRELVEKYKITAGEGSKEFFINGNKKVAFFPISKINGSYQVNTNIGKINILVKNNLYYFNEQELKDLGVID